MCTHGVEVLLRAYLCTNDDSARLLGEPSGSGALSGYILCGSSTSDCDIDGRLRQQAKQTPTTVAAFAVATLLASGVYRSHNSLFSPTTL